MAESLPIPVRTGIAREALDPTAVVPGPQPVDTTERGGHHVIVGEVLRGRHRAYRRRRIAISGAVLSAAGAFVTLALMMNHHPTGVSAGPRVSPSTPVPDLPDEPAQQPAGPASPTPEHAATAAQPLVRTAPPVVHTAHTQAAEVPRHSGFAASAMRQEAVRSAAAWASAMQHAQREAARRQQSQSHPTYEYQGGGRYGSAQQPAGQHQRGQGEHGGGRHHHRGHGER